MPKGKRAFGAVGWHQPVSANVVDVDAFLDWRRPDLPELTDARERTVMLESNGRARTVPRLAARDPAAHGHRSEEAVEKIRRRELAPMEVRTPIRVHFSARPTKIGNFRWHTGLTVTCRG